MDYGKYIIIECMGCENVIMFDASQSHDSFLNMFSKEFVVSAGFFTVGAKESPDDPEDITVSAFGKSSTLGIESRPNTDNRLIKKVLRKSII